MGQQTPWSNWYIRCIKAPLITWAPGLVTTPVKHVQVTCPKPLRNFLVKTTGGEDFKDPEKNIALCCQRKQLQHAGNTSGSSFKKQRRCVGMTNHDRPIWIIQRDGPLKSLFIRDLSVPYFSMIIKSSIDTFHDFPIFFIPSSPPKSMTFGSSAMRRLPRRRRALAHLPGGRL